MNERKTKTKFKKILKATLFAGVFVLITTLSYSANVSANITEAVDSPLITYANETRSENGLGVLTPNSQLTEAAQEKAEDIINNQYFDHTRPDGVEPWDFIKDAGYTYRFAGENLAIGFTDYNDIHNAWLNSPSHRRNILNERFDEIGIGVTRGIYNGKEVVVVVEMFGSN